jgi:hypothetical protein
VSYRAGIGPGLLSSRKSLPPAIVCDRCGAERRLVAVDARDLMPPRWFFAGKPPPSWRGLRSHDGSHRWDLCPACWRDPDAPKRVPPKGGSALARRV